MTAYYNEHEKYAADWLRNLIAAGLIADGVVDDRSIEDVRPSDLRGFAQCHFFAGIGVWSHALRSAGWPDDRPVWTGSCPCQPFSAAGKGDGLADERHLWPAWLHLIRQSRPARIYGEQVASTDALDWWDTVCADLEAEDYPCGAFDLCAAGIAAPHIRQRLYWLADDNLDGRASVSWRRIHHDQHHAQSRGRDGGLAHGGSARLEGRDARALGLQRAAAERGCTAGLVGHADQVGRQAGHHGHAAWGLGLAPVGADSPGLAGLLDLPTGIGLARVGDQPAHLEPLPTDPLAGGWWADCDWIPCSDGKWRPVEPGTFPLAHGVTNRVGRLRAYGNAIVAPLAQTFITATL